MGLDIRMVVVVTPQSPIPGLPTLGNPLGESAFKTRGLQPGDIRSPFENGEFSILHGKSHMKIKERKKRIFQNPYEVVHSPSKCVAFIQDTPEHLVGTQLWPASTLPIRAYKNSSHCNDASRPPRCANPRHSGAQTQVCTSR